MFFFPLRLFKGGDAQKGRGGCYYFYTPPYPPL